MSDRFSRLRLRGMVLWPLSGLVAVALVGLIPPRASEGTILTAGAYVLYALLLLAGLRACRNAGIQPAEVVGPLPRSARPWLRAALLMPLLLMFAALTVWATVSLIGLVAPGWAENLLADREGSGLLERVGTTHRSLLVVNIVVIGPVVEEFVFRGILLRRWVASRGLWPGLLASSAVFAILHPVQLVGAFADGIVLGILYLWSGSLLVPIVVHVLNNGFVTLAILGAKPASSTAEPVELIEGPAEWAFAVVAVLVVAAVIIALVRPLVRQLRQRVIAPSGETP